MENQINAHQAFGDLLDYIFQDLKISDLLNCARVCKLWNETATREIRKRGPEQLVLPHIFDKEIEKDTFHVAKLLNSKPYLAILFVGPSNRERVENERRIQDLEIQVLKKFGKHFPKYLLVVGVDECMVDKTVFTSCNGLLGPATGIPALILPKYQDINIELFTDPSYAIFKQDLKTKLGLSNNSDTKTAILLFGHWGSDCLGILKNIQKKYTLWGGVFDDNMTAINYYQTGKRDITRGRTGGRIAITISGGSIDSWSTVINCVAEKEYVDKELESFRNSLKLRRHTIGLVCGPRYVEPCDTSMYRNSQELMDAVKACFPSIQFTAIFNFGYHYHYGGDSSRDNCDPVFGYKMAMALMILSYG